MSELKPKSKHRKVKLEKDNNIPGLYYCKKIISQNEEKKLLDLINQQNWLDDLSRRVQHYGYKYDYRKRKIDKDSYLGELPKWTQKIEKRIFRVLKENNINLPYNKFDQLIINEYKNNQGISPHVDCFPCFNDGIFSLTTGNQGFQIIIQLMITLWIDVVLYFLYKMQDISGNMK